MNGSGDQEMLQSCFNIPLTHCHNLQSADMKHDEHFEFVQKKQNNISHL